MLPLRSSSLRSLVPGIVLPVLSGLVWLVAPAARLAAQTDPAKDAPVSFSSLVQEEREASQIRRGDSLAKVESVFGAPDQSLAVGVWIYWDYHAASADTAEQGYDTLLIVFKGGQVSDLRTVSRHSAEMVIARFGSPRPSTAGRLAAQDAR